MNKTNSKTNQIKINWIKAEGRGNWNGRADPLVFPTSTKITFKIRRSANGTFLKLSATGLRKISSNSNLHKDMFFTVAAAKSHALETINS